MVISNFLNIDNGGYAVGISRHTKSSSDVLVGVTGKLLGLQNHSVDGDESCQIDLPIRNLLATLDAPMSV